MPETYREGLLLRSLSILDDVSNLKFHFFVFPHFWTQIFSTIVFSVRMEISCPP